MYGVVGEHDSDAHTLKVLIRRLANDSGIRVKSKGFNGCGSMFRKAPKFLALLEPQGYDRFVVSYDADGHDPEVRRQEIIEGILKPSGVKGLRCAIVPIQELEAWILADVEAVTRIFKSWKPKPINNPQSIRKPKKRLISLSKESSMKPRYDHVVYNQQVAKYLDLKKVQAKCESFLPLVNLVRLGKGNCP